MRSASSWTCEPGADRGAHWGQDLFTFVTSAAGYMMRTLQRPRKSRPSKRQVNHRRFLHNMIHRKFAEIEAANRQLATAIFSEDSKGASNQSCGHSEEANTAVLLSPTKDTPFHLPMFSSSGSTSVNQQDEQSSLWTFDIQLEKSSMEDNVVPNVDTEAKSHMFEKEVLCVQDEQGGSKDNELDNQLEYMQQDHFMTFRDILLGDDVNRLTNDEGSRSCLIQPHSTFNISLSSLSESQSIGPSTFNVEFIADSQKTNHIEEKSSCDLFSTFEILDSDPEISEDLPGSWGNPTEGQNYELSMDSTFPTCSNLQTEEHQIYQSRMHTINTPPSINPSSQCTLLCLDPQIMSQTDPTISNNLGKSKSIYNHLSLNNMDGQRFQYFSTGLSRCSSIEQQDIENNDRDEENLKIRTSCRYEMLRDQQANSDRFFLMEVDDNQEDTSLQSISAPEGYNILPYYDAPQSLPKALGCMLSRSEEQERSEEVNSETCIASGHYLRPSYSLALQNKDIYQNHLFVGVATSFPAPKPYANQICSLPLEDDWLFEDIVNNR